MIFYDTDHQRSSEGDADTGRRFYNIFTNSRGSSGGSGACSNLTSSLLTRTHRSSPGYNVTQSALQSPSNPFNQFSLPFTPGRHLHLNNQHNHHSSFSPRYQHSATGVLLCQRELAFARWTQALVRHCRNTRVDFSVEEDRAKRQRELRTYRALEIKRVTDSDTP
ncbi:unnamed protein product [Protopolystoma xenopodis]|uniref:Uncharacterized protein n=1 Tax=Protopolystoma xenopodis TaxID=117903 RepID=A0A3S5FFY7_9PLAT|nr:unnamed protein product [Protopolystoma xenopodis]